MKKISLILGMALIAIAFTSCEDESFDSQDSLVRSKSGFNAEATYWSILANTENGMDQFDALENNQKQQVWTFKYDRFIDDNSLSRSQLNAVNAVKSYVESADFDAEPNESQENALEDQINSSFDVDTSNFLLLTLENGPEDIGQQSSGQNQTEGCFWCWIEVPGGDRTPCTAILNSDGTLIGYSQRVEVRRSRFWFRPGSNTFMANRNCDEDAWDADGRNISYQ